MIIGPVRQRQRIHLNEGFPCLSCGMGDFGERHRIALYDGFDGFDAATKLPVTEYGGQLPVAAWSKADQLVAAAWAVYTDLDKRVRPKITDRTSYLTGALATFKKNVERFSEQTERLKHGPPFDNPNVVNDYLAWGGDFERWAQEIDKTADYGSTWGMFKNVSLGIAKDLADYFQSIGKNVMFTFKWATILLPLVAVGGVLLMFYSFGSRAGSGVGKAAMAVAKRRK